jgi:hypothetical protein
MAQNGHVLRHKSRQNRLGWPDDSGAAEMHLLWKYEFSTLHPMRSATV